MIALIDINSCFASVEEALDPSLRGKPILILSNNDGAIVAASRAAKDMGLIKMFSPYFKIKKQLEGRGVVVMSSNYPLIHDFHRRFVLILREEALPMEIYSVDEAFVALDSIPKSKIVEEMTTLRDKMWKHINIPVSVGIGRTKTLAKIATEVAKKEKVPVLGLMSKEQENMALERVGVRDIWGIGRKKSAKLIDEFMIYNARQLRDYKNDKRILRKFTKVTRQTQDELRGIRCISLEEVEKDKKQIISSRSFGKPILDFQNLSEAISSHIFTASEKLRKQNCVCRELTIFIHTSPFKSNYYSNSETVRFLSGSSAANRLIHVGLKSLKKVYRPGYEYKKCGVILSDFLLKSESQLDFFGAFDSSNADTIMSVMDKINRVEGPGTIKLAACGTKKHWRMLSEMRSKYSTNRISELPIAR